ncbi:MAG: tail fiber domain-containing protein [Bacteroidetes bacterium]|nr:tail fiber domain-containing protein [Bacteroidota bacterium]
MAKFCLLLAGFCCLGHVQAQVGIGTASPNTHAVLELKNSVTPRGLLLPKVGTTQRTVLAGSLTPYHQGMVVADTVAGKLYMWNGSAWEQVLSGAPAPLAWDRVAGNVFLLNATDNVGIGTNTPVSRLEIRQATGYSILQVGEAGNRGGQLQWDPTLKRFSLQTNSHNDPIAVGNNWMYFAISGNVGIGTTSPGTRLEVNGGFRLTDGTQASGRVLTSDATGLASWQPLPPPGITGTGTTNKLAVWNSVSNLLAPANLHWDNTNSRLGIGVATPASTLEMNGNAVIRAVAGNWNDGLVIGRTAASGYGFLSFHTGAGVLEGATGQFAIGLMGDGSTNDLWTLVNGLTGSQLGRADAVMRISKITGNVGIGYNLGFSTLTPEGTIDIVRNQAGDAQATWNAGGFIPYGTEKADIILTRRHGTLVSGLGYSNNLIDFRSHNGSAEASIAQIITTVDPNSGGGFSGGIGLATSGGGGIDPAGRRTSGNVPTVRMWINHLGRVGIANTNPGLHRLSVGEAPAADGQAVSIRGYSNEPGAWKGGAAFGYTSASVIMGELGGVATIGGHNATLGAWANLSINTAGGNVGIGTNAPSAKLHVIGNLRLEDGTQAAGRVLTSDASGNAAWQTPAGGTTASNGIVKVVDDIRMGGSLMQHTSIANGLKHFEITGYSEPVIDVNQPTSGVGAGGGDNTQYWQSWTVVGNGFITQIGVEFFDNIGAGFSLNIYAGVGTGGALLTSASGFKAPLGIAYLAMPLSVTAGQQYTMQIINGGGARYGFGSGTYAGGQCSFNSGNADMTFKTYLSQPTSPLFVSGPNGRVGINTNVPDVTFSVNGNASKVGGGSWATFSDARLKHLHGNYTRGLKEILALDPVIYSYNGRNGLNHEDGRRHTGFMAQDVQKVIPEAVTTNAEGYLMLNQDPILWAMLNAIKEQNQQVHQLQQENAELKSRLERLEQMLGVQSAQK